MACKCRLSTWVILADHAKSKPWRTSYWSFLSSLPGICPYHVCDQAEIPALLFTISRSFLARTSALSTVVDGTARFIPGIAAGRTIPALSTLYVFVSDAEFQYSFMTVVDVHTAQSYLSDGL